MPEPSAGSAAAYAKHSLRRMDVAFVGAAALVIPGDGVVGELRIALGAVAPTPIRAARPNVCCEAECPPSH